MKKVISLITALAVCFALACPVFAAEDFVPSIGYKDGPDIDEATMDGEIITDCLAVTSISEAKNKSTDISQEARDELLDVYDQLSDGSMKLPMENNDYVVRELVDVSFTETCVNGGDGHKEKLAEDGTTVTITFDMGVDADTEVVVMVYVDGKWVPAEEVKNNGDGTVDVTFEDICPVAFCVEEGAQEAPPYTGAALDENLTLWIVLMAVSVAAIVVLLMQRRKTAR